MLNFAYPVKPIISITYTIQIIKGCINAPIATCSMDKRPAELATRISTKSTGQIKYIN